MIDAVEVETPAVDTDVLEPPPDAPDLPAPRSPAPALDPPDVDAPGADVAEVADVRAGTIERLLGCAVGRSFDPDPSCSGSRDALGARYSAPTPRAQTPKTIDRLIVTASTPTFYG